MQYLLLLVLSLLLICGCSDDKAVNTGGGLETETISNISGRIVDDKDQNIANALVIATKSEKDIILRSDTVLTNSEGIYTFTTLDTGTFDFSAEKTIDEVLHTARIGSHYNNQAAFSFGIDTLIATGTICGIVRTEDEKESYMGITVYIPGTSFSARTDSSGNFAMSFVLLGTHKLACEFDGYETAYNREVTLQNPGDTAWIQTVKLKEKMGPDNFNISGTIVNSLGDSIFSKMPIVIEKLDTDNTVLKKIVTDTDSKGTFFYYKGEIGTYRISMTDTVDGLIYAASNTHTFELANHKNLPLVFVKPKNGYLNGTVTFSDITANEHNGVTVRIKETGREAYSDTLGRYSFDYLSPGTYTLQFSADSYDPIEQEITVALENDTTTTSSVSLTPTKTFFSLTATYLYPDGTVATGAEARLYKYYQDSTLASTKIKQVIWTGKAVFDTLYSGLYSIAVSVNRDDTVYVDSSNLFTLSEIKDVSLPVKHLQVFDPKLGKIRGTVSLAGSPKLKNIVVRLDHTNLFTVTNDDGSFLIRDIPFGTYYCKCNYEGYIIDGTTITIASSYDTLTVPHQELQPIKEPFIQLVHIKGGSFKDNHDDRAYVSDFHMGKTEVTLGAYKKFDPTWVNLAGTQNDYEPVAGVSFSQAVQFCNWLSIREGLDSCYVIDPTQKAKRLYGDDLYWKVVPEKNGYRLPSGDEWQHAAQGEEIDGFGYRQHATDDGTLRLFENVTKSNAWIPPTSQNTLQKVLQFRANKNGLFDMTGNVWEYTWELSTKVSKGIIREDYFEADSAMNGEYVQVRGASGIWPDPENMLSEEEMKVKHSHDAKSTRPYFSDAARGFRVVIRK